MSHFRAALVAHVPFDADEARHRARLLAHVDGGGDLFTRTRYDGHVTGSAFILDAGRRHVLLLKHKKLGIWVQPGGHGEPNENDARVIALREAREETGLLGLEFLQAAIFDVDVHAIPARRDEPAHEHLDVRYLLRAPPGADARIDVNEADGWRWVPIEECAALEASLARPAAKLLRR